MSVSGVKGSDRGPRPPRPLHVLVVDDSAVVRQVMIALLSRDPALSVEVAADPFIAMDKMKRKRPDVILLDLEMPRMDGLTFLARIMAEDPIPVVVCSGVAARGTEAALGALERGAVEIVTKPALGVRDFLEESGVTLIDTLRAAAEAKLRPRGLVKLGARPRASADSVVPPLAKALPAVDTDKVVAVGASTGGTEALAEILEALPPEVPGLAIVQHMPALFTAAFARRLNAVCRIEVKEAVQGDRVVAGRALIAPGNRHMLLRRKGGQYLVEISDGPFVSRHRPSVDVLFRSTAQAAGRNAVGVILTGMGADGADGLLELKRAGGSTIAQDEASCVVFGMPREAIARGAADEVAPLQRIPGLIVSMARSVSR